jgi:hypothetical protein
LDELSAQEGWDGNELSDIEIINGPDANTGFDRNLQMEDELSLQRENDILRQQIAEQENFVQTYLAKPLTDEARAQQRSAIRNQLEQRYGLMDLGDDAKLDRFIADVATDMQHMQGLENARVNASLQHDIRFTAPILKIALATSPAWTPLARWRGRLFRTLCAAPILAQR